MDTTITEIETLLRDAERAGNPLFPDEPVTGERDNTVRSYTFTTRTWFAFRL
jgi:hypothetical protein